MKIKAIILSLLFLLSGSGFTFKISTCCDVFSGIAITFERNIPEPTDCCACVKASKKSTCCHTQLVSTPINSNLGLQKTSIVSFKIFAENIALFPPIKSENKVSVNQLNTYYLSAFEQRQPYVPILVQKCVLQI